MEIKDIAGTVQALVTSLGILVGGGWVLWKFVLQREHESRPEFTVGVEFVGVHGGQWLVEVWATMTNKGSVAQRMSQLVFDLRVLQDTDPVTDGGDKIGCQVNIPHKVREASWLPPGWRGTHVDPGVTTRYSYVASIPLDARYVLVHGKLVHARGGDWHTADRLQRVPAPDAPTPANPVQ